MNKRNTERPTAVWTAPVQAVGIDAKHRTAVNKTRAPYLSQPGPKIKRIKIVPATPTILDVQTSLLSKSNDFLISGNNGAMENQIKKAMKNDHQEQWNALYF